MKVGVLLCVALGGLLSFARPAAAEEPYELQLILPLSGPGAFTGAGEQKTLGALTDFVNQHGGINGRPLKLTIHDDQTSPQVAVQLANQIMASHPPVFIGSTITAMCNAEAPLVRNGPVMYCYSPGFHQAAGTYAFSGTIATHDLVQALIRYYRLRGWTRLAMIITTDATGQDIEAGINDVLAMAENKSVEMVHRERFNPTDLSVNAQIERIMADKPQALIAWTTGSPVATIFKSIVQTGVDIPVGATNGNSSIPELEAYASFLPKQLYIPTGPYIDHEGVFKLDPRVEQAQQEMYAELKSHDVPLDNQAATPWDATMIVVDTLRAIGTNVTAEQIRDHIAKLTNYPGIWGIYNFPEVPQRGLDAGWAVVTRWDAAKKRFEWTSEPGGKPLDK